MTDIGGQTGGAASEWWSDPDTICAATMTVLMRLHVLAMEHGAYRAAAPLAEAWMALARGPWRERPARLRHGIDYRRGVTWLHPLLARLQELSPESDARRAIAEASTHVDRVAAELPVRVFDPRSPLS